MKIESRTSQFEFCTHKGVRNRPGVVGVCVRAVKLKKRGSDFTCFRGPRCCDWVIRSFDNHINLTFSGGRDDIQKNNRK